MKFDTHTHRVDGDQPGVGLGVKSGTVGAPAWPMTASSTVFVNDQPLWRDGDKAWMNNANNPGELVHKIAPNPDWAKENAPTYDDSEARKLIAEAQAQGAKIESYTTNIVVSGKPHIVLAANAAACRSEILAFAPDARPSGIQLALQDETAAQRLVAEAAKKAANEAIARAAGALAIRAVVVLGLALVFLLASTGSTAGPELDEYHPPPKKPDADPEDEPETETGGGTTGGGGADTGEDDPCRLGKHRRCPKDGRSHHIISDYIFRLFDPSTRYVKAPAYDNEALTICLTRDEHTAVTDAISKEVPQLNNGKGYARFDDVREKMIDIVNRKTADRCKGKFEQQLRNQYKNKGIPDDTLMRTTYSRPTPEADAAIRQSWGLSP